MNKKLGQRFNELKDQLATIDSTKTKAEGLYGLVDTVDGVCQTSCRDHYVMHSQL